MAFRCWFISREPVTRSATFCSSVTFQLTNSSMSGWSRSSTTILAARRVVPPALDRPGGAVADLEEAHQPRRLAAARKRLALTAEGGEVAARARAVLEDAGLADPQVHDAAVIDEIVVDGLDKAGMRRGPLVGGSRKLDLVRMRIDVAMPLRRPFDAVGPVQASVEPLRAIRARPFVPRACSRSRRRRRAHRLPTRSIRPCSPSRSSIPRGDGRPAASRSRRRWGRRLIRVRSAGATSGMSASANVDELRPARRRGGSTSAARISTATCDHFSGTRTSFISKTTDPFGFRMVELRGTKVIDAKGSVPSRVKRRLICMVEYPTRKRGKSGDRKNGCHDRAAVCRPLTMPGTCPGSRSPARGRRTRPPQPEDHSRSTRKITPDGSARGG